MVSPLIATKLYIPKLRPDAVIRKRLKERLDQGFHRKLSLISASTGYGKTTLVTEWLSSCDRPVAWLSLDEEDNDINRFLAYLIAALRTIAEQHEFHASVLLKSPQSPPAYTIISVLINDLARLAEPIILVIDDYHLISSKPIHDSISLLLGHMPPNLHMVILTREEPDLDLSLLRVRDEVTDLGVKELRFNNEETALFLKHTMNLELSIDMVFMLEERTEGWIAGLQIAALSMQGQQAVEAFPSLSLGNQRVLLDYLVTEVLQKQSESTQIFLLYTSILDRFCGSLCNALLPEDLSIYGNQVLYTLERANLFIVSLDNEQRWYRYHHLFANLLRQQLQQRIIRTREIEDTAVLHHRASVWYEKNGLNLEAFRHAVAANDIGMASRLAEGDGLPLHLQGEVAPVLSWLELLPRTELDARPSLWVIYGSALLMAGRPTDVESKLQAAEAALPVIATDAKPNNLLGLIATTRAAIAAFTFSGQSEPFELKLQAAENALQATNTVDKTNELVASIVPTHDTVELNTEQVDIVIKQCNLALQYLAPEFLPVRITALWMLGVAYQLCGKHAEAQKAFIEVLSFSRKMGGNIIEVMANVGLGRLMETEKRFYEAEEYYRRALLTNGDLPLSAICEAYLGLARICYMWSDLEASMRHVRKSVQLARQADSKDIIVTCMIMIARLKHAQQDWRGGFTVLAEAKKLVHEYRLLNRMPEIEEMQMTGILLQRDSSEQLEPLSQRELEVLQLISLGYSNQEIGKELFLAIDTVKGHNRRIFAKLQVERRTEAVAIARKLGWIE